MLRPDARLFGDEEQLGRTFALLAVQGGSTVLERYAEGFTHESVLPSYSVSKSVLHAAVGIAVGEGLLDLDAPAGVPQWRRAGDPRRAITLRQLLLMRSGLEWDEDYLSPDSDVVHMLYGDGGGPLRDVAAYAASKPLVEEPGRRFHYSSGTANIVSSLLAEVTGRGGEGDRWLDDRLFGPLGMRSRALERDAAGTWIASSYCACTARDYARLGQLYLQDGRWDGERLLPAGWVDTARVETGRDDEGHVFSMHWFVVPEDPWGTFHCSGFLGQLVMVVPELDLVVVRLGEGDHALREQLLDEVMRFVASFAPHGAGR